MAAGRGTGLGEATLTVALVPRSGARSRRYQYPRGASTRTEPARNHGTTPDRSWRRLVELDTAPVLLVLLAATRASRAEPAAGVRGCDEAKVRGVFVLTTGWRAHDSRLGLGIGMPNASASAATSSDALSKRCVGLNAVAFANHASSASGSAVWRRVARALASSGLPARRE